MLTLENIQWELPGGEQIVRGIDLTVAAGKLTVITGHETEEEKPRWQS